MRRLLLALAHCVRESWDGISRNPSLSFLTALSVGVSLYVLGLFLLLLFNLNALVDTLGRDIQVQIFLDPAADGEAVTAVHRRLAEDAAVDEARMVTSDEARRRFQTNFPSLGDLPDKVGGRIFPTSFELTLGEGHRDAPSVERLARAYEEMRGVEEVRYDLGWIRRLAGMIALVRHGGYGIGLLLLGTVMVTVGAVVRLTILARREEIAIMKLVGATAAFVRGPFLLGASLQGLLGGGFAVCALLLTHRLVGRSITFTENPVLSMVAGRFLPAEAAASLIVGGALVGFLAAALALRRAGAR